ncbi:MAG: hypothetical protein ACI9UA_006077 [Pseudoalteromonas tetraodonis]|jgi:hypothetical protein
MRIITGCSRSGTSFVSQAIQRLGGDFGERDELIEGDRWNKKGYFENRAINTVNHRLLFGRWSNPKLWVDIMWPKRKPLIHLRKLATIAQGPLLSHPALIRRRGRALRGEMETLGHSLEGKVVKDPRFSYLMEPWEATGSVHSVLYVVRNPREAAMSMSRQTRLPLRLTYLGWVDAIRKFWDHPPVVPVHIVDYNAFFDREKRHGEMRTLMEFLDRKYDGALADQVLDEVLDEKLRTQKGVEQPLPRKVAAVYHGLLARRAGTPAR